GDPVLPSAARNRPVRVHSACAAHGAVRPSLTVTRVSHPAVRVPLAIGAPWRPIALAHPSLTPLHLLVVAEGPRRAVLRAVCVEVSKQARIREGIADASLVLPPSGNPLQVSIIPDGMDSPETAFRLEVLRPHEPMVPIRGAAVPTPHPHPAVPVPVVRVQAPGLCESAGDSHELVFVAFHRSNLRLSWVGRDVPESRRGR